MRVSRDTHPPRQAEIADLQQTVRVHQQVTRLQVAMHNGHIVAVVDATDQLIREALQENLIGVTKSPTQNSSCIKHDFFFKLYI